MSDFAPSAEVLFNRLMARLRLRHLQLLTAVADTGSIQRAAEQMGLSQPAATQSIAEIERLLELVLFERHARGMRLTPFGAALVPIARRAVRALVSATETLAELRDGHDGLVRLGMISAAQSLVQATLPAFSQAQPRVLIEAVIGSVTDLIDRVHTGTLDLVLCREQGVLPKGLSYAPLATEMVSVVCDGRSALAHEPLTLAQAQRHLWVVPPRGVGARPVFDALWPPGEAPLLHPVSTTSMPLLVSLLRTLPQALAIAPRNLLRSYCEWGVISEVALTLPPGANLQLGQLGLVFSDAGLAHSARLLSAALGRQAREG